MYETCTKRNLLRSTLNRIYFHGLTWFEEDFRTSDIMNPVDYSFSTSPTSIIGVVSVISDSGINLFQWTYTPRTHYRECQRYFWDRHDTVKVPTWVNISETQRVAGIAQGEHDEIFQ